MSRKIKTKKNLCMSHLLLGDLLDSFLGVRAWGVGGGGGGYAEANYNCRPCAVHGFGEAATVGPSTVGEARSSCHQSGAHSPQARQIAVAPPWATME